MSIYTWLIIQIWVQPSLATLEQFNWTSENDILCFYSGILWVFSCWLTQKHHSRLTGSIVWLNHSWWKTGSLIDNKVISAEMFRPIDVFNALPATLPRYWPILNMYLHSERSVRHVTSEPVETPSLCWRQTRCLPGQIHKSLYKRERCPNWCERDWRPSNGFIKYEGRSWTHLSRDISDTSSAIDFQPSGKGSLAWREGERFWRA